MVENLLCHSGPILSCVYCVENVLTVSTYIALNVLEIQEKYKRSSANDMSLCKYYGYVCVCVCVCVAGVWEGMGRDMGYRK